MVTNFLVIISFAIYAALLNRWFTQLATEKSLKIERNLKELKDLCE